MTKYIGLFWISGALFWLSGCSKTTIGGGGEGRNNTPTNVKSPPTPTPSDQGKQEAAEFLEEHSKHSYTTQYETTVSQISVNDDTLVFFSKSTSGAQVIEHIYKVKAKDLNPSKVKVEESFGARWDIIVLSSESMKLISYTRKGPPDGLISQNEDRVLFGCGYGPDGERRAMRLSKAIRQYITACGGKPDKFDD